VFSRGAFDAAFGPKMRLHVSLRERVQTSQDLGRDGLQMRYDERQMESAVQLARGDEVFGGERCIQVTEGFSCGLTVSGGGKLRAFTDGSGFDLQAQPKYLVKLAGSERTDLKAAIGIDID
jgi:hypothetical protein